MSGDRIKVSPAKILPSQNFLKPGTVEFIFMCYETNRLEDLPPSPIVRNDEDGNLLAIDGHNLIAVKLYKNEEIEVHLAKSADDGLPPGTEADRKRNLDLKEKFDSVLEDRIKTEAEGVHTFSDLVARYPDIFPPLLS